MDTNEIYNPTQFLELNDQLKQLEMLSARVEKKSIARRISQYSNLVRGELNDLDIIWRRFLKDRQELIDLAPLSTKYLGDQEKYYSEEARKVFGRELELTNSIKVDLKSLFLYSDILLNKLVLLIRAVVNQKREIKYRSYTSFLKSLRKLDISNLGTTWEYALYQMHGDDLERIDVLLGFYRDKFIVHVSEPYQEGISRSVYLPEISIDHTSWALDEFDLEKFMALVRELGDIVPERDKYGRPIDQVSDPRPKVEALFVNLHRIKNPDLRERAEDFVRSIGLKSPDIYYLVKILKESSRNIINSLSEQIEKSFLRK